MAYNIDRPDTIKAARNDLSNSEALLALAPYGQTGKTLWVDSVYGNDATANRQRRDKPFLTLNAAKVAAQAGDTIVVLPGTYNEKNLLKNAVNWHFVNGAVVNYIGSSDGGIFDDSSTGLNSAATCKITGFGSFIKASATSSGGVVIVEKTGSYIYIEGNLLENQYESAANQSALQVGVSLASLVVTLKFDKIKASYDLFLGGNPNAEIHVNARILQAGDGEPGASGSIAEWSGGSLNIVAEECISSVDCECPLYIFGGDIRLKGAIVTCYNQIIILDTSGASATIENCKLVTNGMVNGIEVASGSTISLKNCSIICGGTYSITGGGTAKAYIMNSYANKPVNAITQKIGAIIVNSDMV